MRPGEVFSEHDAAYLKRLLLVFNEGWEPSVGFLGYFQIQFKSLVERLQLYPSLHI